MGAKPPENGKSRRLAKRVVKIQRKKTTKPAERRTRPHWYKLECFWSGEAQPVMKVNDENVLLVGWIPPDNDVAVCLVPPSVGQEQGLALEKILEANLRAPVLVLTNNTQLVKLAPISDAEAQRIMKEGADAVIQVAQAEMKGSQSRTDGDQVAEAGSSE